MKIEDLSFAAQVLSLAEKINTDDFTDMKNSFGTNSPDLDAAMATWLKENPVLDYIPRAYALISQSARHIEQLRAGQA